MRSFSTIHLNLLICCCCCYCYFAYEIKSSVQLKIKFLKHQTWAVKKGAEESTHVRPSQTIRNHVAAFKYHSKQQDKKIKYEKQNKKPLGAQRLFILLHHKNRN